MLKDINEDYIITYDDGIEKNDVLIAKIWKYLSTILIMETLSLRGTTVAYVYFNKKI
jgi:hypothetical protein